MDSECNRLSLLQLLRVERIECRNGIYSHARCNGFAFLSIKRLAIADVHSALYLFFGKRGLVSQLLYRSIEYQKLAHHEKYFVYLNKMIQLDEIHRDYGNHPIHHKYPSIF